MNQLNKRLTKLEAEAPEIDTFDLSLLTDQELEFMENCLTKAGFEWNKEGDLTLLSKNELTRFEKLYEKSKNRINKLETASQIQCESFTKPNNLKELYELEQDPDSEIGQSFRALYNENRESINPNEAIK